MKTCLECYYNGLAKCAYCKVSNVCAYYACLHSLPYASVNYIKPFMFMAITPIYIGLPCSSTEN